ncbi:hypothetical protein MKZ38_003452 [Zalerion maritima]|uniref:Uncharacterized protein n=1 Tax=Zalerion maritima TaxID=339359 RepID=A0AAD5RYC5_9PEZI|nr:hypothetical protein MKZ38_003452 [Zalerion maritima]
MGFTPVDGVESYNDSGYYLWEYVPSIPAGAIFTVLFFGITLLHLVEMFKNRLWFMIPFSVGGVFETTGYISRCLAHSSTGSLTPYATQSFVILVAPRAARRVRST